MDKHDDTFEKIFQEEKNLAHFFDAFFGFLYRRTEFYTVTDGRPPGYPPGISRDILFSIYEKWKKVKENEKEGDKKDEKPKSSRGRNRSTNSNNSNKPTSLPPWTEGKNGASYDKYRWSQTRRDLDVVVLVPPEIREASDLQVRLMTGVLQVKTEETVLVGGMFPHHIVSGQSFWFLEPGKQLIIHLEKADLRWWDRLLEHEPPIDMTKLESDRDTDEEIEDYWNSRELLRNLQLRDRAEQAAKEKEATGT